MDKELYEVHADICKTLGNPKRIEIINTLGDRELSVGDLVDILGISSSNISQHLAVMKQKGIVTSRREGVNIYYKIANPKVTRACELMREVLIEKLDSEHKMARKFSSVRSPDPSGK